MSLEQYVKKVSRVAVIFKTPVLLYHNYTFFRYNETCEHCVAFLLFLATRRNNETYEYRDIQVWKKTRNSTVPVRELEARNECEFYELCTVTGALHAQI